MSIRLLTLAARSLPAGSASRRRWRRRGYATWATLTLAALLALACRTAPPTSPSPPPSPTAVIPLPTSAATPMPGIALPTPTATVAAPTSPIPAIMPPTPSPAAATLPPPCTAQQLEAAFIGVTAATGNALGVFALRNTGDQPCTLQGYVQLILLNAQGQPIQMPAQQTTQALFGQTVPPPSPVVLPPGTPPLTPPRSAATAGHAFVRVIWTNICGDGVNPAAIAIVPPGDTQPIPVAIDPSWQTAFTICAHIGPKPAGLRILPIEATPPSGLDLSS
ncbi:DUF4232 domain-containing protein [Thermomicrobiaceae bacterium CFH 74404]|uniref:DUF4232 domain-containing protein n=1 Tax=Thermalbibacter longus TaxID=2951981 RepID=A0AA41WB61_9BACT|nr:DUF4232 domain-containing protein [Thermalbibacter longus]MCM8749367.1 DUF4232 domain-containing protein [Thermalbibacter longus]